MTNETEVTWTPPDIRDNTDNSLSQGVPYNPGDLFPLGVTVVNYTATDDTGNVGFCTFLVTVVGMYLHAFCFQIPFLQRHFYDLHIYTYTTPFQTIIMTT